MQASLLEILREIPDHRRREGKRFDLATVLLYSIRNYPPPFFRVPIEGAAPGLRVLLATDSDL
ncbi:MAG: transposase family protein [Alphaproteobacteria bacterium]|nr:transposase family protein [Alphaproteobacteria bacterium]MBM3641262.1 transposase family protein [Alphaproteobacteria bacterium]